MEWTLEAEAEVPIVKRSGIVQVYKHTLTIGGIKSVLLTTGCMETEAWLLMCLWFCGHAGQSVESKAHGLGIVQRGACGANKRNVQ